MLALQDTCGVGDDTLFKASTGFVGGAHRMGSICGALAGGILALSVKYGRGREDLGGDSSTLQSKYPHPVIREFYARFRQAEGSALCNEITGIDLDNDEQRAKWNKAGGHDACMKRVGRTARLAAEFLV